MKHISQGSQFNSLKGSFFYNKGAQLLEHTNYTFFSYKASKIIVRFLYYLQPTSSIYIKRI